MTARWLPGRDRGAVCHPAAGGGLRLPEPAPRVLVVGGGVAGVAAAVGLAERGARVVLAERHPQLGGRVRSWPVSLGGETVAMSRGFHAFFRQYYNLRALLRRVDPALDGLVAVPDYPVVMADGAADSFARVPRTPPLNLLLYALRSPNFGVRNLLRADIGASSQMLDLRFPEAFAEFDDVSAAEFLDRLDFPPAVRHLALEVFARSFFAEADDFSAGELLAMFHLYFVGSAEGLLFDVARDDFDAVFFGPLRRYLERLGVAVRTGDSVSRLAFGPAGGAGTAAGGAPVAAYVGDTRVAADALVLATDVRSSRRLVAESDGFPDATAAARIAATANAPAFVVWRLWLDRPVRVDRPEFLGTGGFELLDNVSVVSIFEHGARAWAHRHGGAVVEMHAYALPDGWNEPDVRRRLRAELAAVYPETEPAEILHEEWILADDCPSWGPGRWRSRPDVRTGDARVVLAGDGIRCDLPVALMERAATTGWQAANTLLESWGVRGHDIWSVPLRSRVPGVPVLRRLVS